MAGPTAIDRIDRSAHGPEGAALWPAASRAGNSSIHSVITFGEMADSRVNRVRLSGVVGGNDRRAMRRARSLRSRRAPV